MFDGLSSCIPNSGVDKLCGVILKTLSLFLLSSRALMSFIIAAVHLVEDYKNKSIRVFYSGILFNSIDIVPHISTRLKDFAIKTSISPFEHDSHLLPGIHMSYVQVLF